MTKIPHFITSTKGANGLPWTPSPKAYSPYRWARWEIVSAIRANVEVGRTGIECDVVRPVVKEEGDTGIDKRA